MREKKRDGKALEQSRNRLHRVNKRHENTQLIHDMVNKSSEVELLQIFPFDIRKEKKRIQNNIPRRIQRETSYIDWRGDVTVLHGQIGGRVVSKIRSADRHIEAIDQQDQNIEMEMEETLENIE